MTGKGVLQAGCGYAWQAPAVAGGKTMVTCQSLPGKPNEAEKGGNGFGQLPQKTLQPGQFWPVRAYTPPVNSGQRI